MRFGGRCDFGDDEVVASYRVYFSPSLAGHTHVFQYPMRTRGRSYEASETKLFCTEGPRDVANGDSSSSSSSSWHKNKPAVIKPSSRLTMRHTLDTFGSPNFRPKENNCEGTSKCVDQTNSYRYEYTLFSEPFTPRSDYCIAYFTGNEVHLTPVSTVQRLYPTHESNGNAEHTVYDNDISDDKSGCGALRVGKQHMSVQAGPSVTGAPMADRFSRELDRQRSVVLNADASTAKELLFFSSRSAESAAMRRCLVSTAKEAATVLRRTALPEEAVGGNLFPPEILVSGGITGGTDRTSRIIRPFASRWTVADQVAQLMMRCQILSLPVIEQHVVKPSESKCQSSSSSGLAAEIVSALRLRAVYMHGVWISRASEEFKGAAAALREVILLMFFHSTNGAVARVQLNRLVSSGALRRTIKEILSTVAVLNTEEPDPEKRAWRLRYVPSSPSEYQASVCAFVNAFPAEVAAQITAWEKRASIIMSHLHHINISRVPPRLALETAHSSPGSALPHSPTGGVGPLPSTTGARGPAGAEIREQDLAPIRQYIRMLFAEHGVVNKQRAKELVTKAKEANFPGATAQMLGSAMQSSVQPFTDSTWVLKSLGEPTVDKHRPLILQCILELQQFEMASLQRRVDEVMTERGEFIKQESNPDAHAVPLAVLKRVVGEVAEFRVAERLYHIKAGNVMT